MLLIGGLVICAVYVMRYAKRVKADPSRSVVARQRNAHRKLFLQGHDDLGDVKLSLTRNWYW